MGNEYSKSKKGIADEDRLKHEDIWQMPVALLPVSRGQSQGESLILRPINSTEAMTANFSHLPMDKVKVLADKVMAEVKFEGIFYDVTNKPPGTIEWE